MERKTMGSFIAALRKANGMTQKELAERLHVSDKSVSRWERDEGVPDLALIPVIAEVFGVTCDELLRGERRPPEPAPAPAAGPDPKAEKQRQRLLNKTLTGFRNQSIASVALAASALCCAAGINLGLYKGLIALCVGAVVLLLAALLEVFAVNNAFLAVAGEEEEKTASVRNTIVRWAERVFTFILTLLAFLLPLALAGGYGLTAVSWLLWGLPAALIALVIGVTVCGFVDGRRLEDPDLALPEPQAAALRHNARLARRTGLGLAAAWVLTLVLHALLTHGWSEWALRPATTFSDWGSFVAFMEQEKEATFYGPAAPAPDVESGDVAWEAAAQGDTDTPEPKTITAEDGSVVCTFYWRNRQVTGWSYGTVDGRPVPPVRVHTQRDGEIGRARLRQYNMVFGCLYAAEALAAALLFALRRKAVPKL